MCSSCADLPGTEPFRSDWFTGAVYLVPFVKLSCDFYYTYTNHYCTGMKKTTLQIIVCSPDVKHAFVLATTKFTQ